MFLALKIALTLLYVVGTLMAAMNAAQTYSQGSAPSLLEATASYAILMALIMFAERFPKPSRGD